MGGSNLMSLSVSYGMISDHLPIMEYILRDKAARGQRIKSVLLLLDADFFGKPAWTNSNINSFLPPELSGEPASRYWWRYLTVFQFRLWRDVIRHARVASPASTQRRRSQHPLQRKLTAPTAVDPACESAPLPLAPPRLSSYRRSFNSTRPDLERQLKQFDRYRASSRLHLDGGHDERAVQAADADQEIDRLTRHAGNSPRLSGGENAARSADNSFSSAAASAGCSESTTSRSGRVIDDRRPAVHPRIPAPRRPARLRHRSARHRHPPEFAVRCHGNNPDISKIARQGRQQGGLARLFRSDHEDDRQRPRMAMRSR